MITINCYNFSKKENSTARPSGSGKSYSCAVKTGSSIISPVIEISDTSLPSYNYAYISNFKRYYFITNIVYDRGIWVLSLTVDVMATYRPGIGSTSGFVLRSSRRSQPALIDTLYPVTGNSAVNQNVFEYGNLNTFSGGSVAINVLTKAANPGQSTFWFDYANFQAFCISLQSDLCDTSISRWDNVDQSIKVQTYEPLRYIGSAYWFPESFQVGSAVTSLQLGNYVATGFTCNKFSTSTSPVKKHYSVSIPKHPQTESHGKWVNLSPYAEYQLQLPPYGTINLDTTAMLDAETIDISILRDTLTGSSRCIITTDTGASLADITGQWGVPVRIASLISTDLGAGLGAVVSGGMAVGAALAGDWGGAIQGAMQTVKGIGDMVKGSVNTFGSTGSMVDHWTNKMLYSRFFYLTDADNANNGRPYCYNNTPANLGGYMQMQKGLFVSDTATQTEINSVNAFMEGGFYYE